MLPTTISFQNVTKTFGTNHNPKYAVRTLSWQAASGEVTGLLGPNGAGKTTIIRLLLDLMRPDVGEVLIDGDLRLNQTAAFRQSVGYLPEERALYKHHRIIDTLCYLGMLKGMPSSEAKKKVVKLLTKMNLSEYAKKSVETLSKGMAQRVQLASCIVHDPQLIILDEPFSGLDPVNVRAVRELILDAKSKGKMIILCTHMMAEVEALCDRIVLVHRGEKLLEGEIKKIQREFARCDVMLDKDAQPENLSCVRSIHQTATHKCVVLLDGMTRYDLMKEMAENRRAVRSFEDGAASLEDIFVSLTSGASVS